MGRALLLNASYEPHSIITDRDAVCMYLDDVVTIVEYSGEVFHSPSISVLVPSICVLRKYVDMPDGVHRTVLLTTRNVLTRDSYLCEYCDGLADTRDHIKPRARGGLDTWDNVIAACTPCNRKKANHTLDELGWKLRRTPFQPHGAAARLMAMQPEDSWLPYFGVDKISA